MKKRILILSLAMAIVTLAVSTHAQPITRVDSFFLEGEGSLKVFAPRLGK